MTKCYARNRGGKFTLLLKIKKFTMSKIRQETLKKAAVTYRESLRRSLQHRLEMARTQGNDKLVRQLEAEANYLHIR